MRLQGRGLRGGKEKNQRLSIIGIKKIFCPEGRESWPPGARGRPSDTEKVGGKKQKKKAEDGEPVPRDGRIKKTSSDRVE